MVSCWSPRFDRPAHVPLWRSLAPRWSVIFSKSFFWTYADPCSGSVFVSGSNPNPDYVAPGPGVTYATEYRVERFYPWYYDKRRPEPKGVPTTLSYGGNYWQANLTVQDLNNDPATYIQKTKAVVIRTGFSTHAINMSQRLVELGLSYNVHDDGTATIYVSQMPPNPATFQPGPASTSGLVLTARATTGMTDAMLVFPQCSSSRSMAYPPSHSGSRSAAERLRRRPRPTQRPCQRAASRIRSPAAIVALTRATTTATMPSRRRGRRSMQDPPPSLYGLLPPLVCFLRRRTNSVWYDLYELSKSRVLFHPTSVTPCLVVSFLLTFFIADASYGHRPTYIR